MKRLYALSCILVLVTALAGCHHEEKTKLGTLVPPPQAQVEPQQKLKRDIEQLVSQRPANLKVQRQNGGTYKAAPYFTERTVEMLKRSRAVKDREGEIKTYDFKLSFEGYEDIFLNSQTGLFRFEGEDPIYGIDLWSEEYWKRSVLKEINGEILYSSFEKDVIAQHSDMDLDKDGNSDDVLLYYDGDIRLKVMDSDVPVLVGASRDAVSSLTPTNHYNCNLYIRENPGKNLYQFLVGITYEFTNKYGSTSWLTCYEYTNGTLKKVWSSDEELLREMKAVEYGNGVLTLQIDGLKELKKLRVAEAQIANIENLKDAKNSSGWQAISLQGLILPRYGFYDYDNDGEEELVMGIVVQNETPLPLLIGDVYCSAYAFTPDGLMLKDSFFASDNNALMEAMY